MSDIIRGNMKYWVDRFWLLESWRIAASPRIWKIAQELDTERKKKKKDNKSPWGLE